jgi:hypothetical protein
LQNLKEITSSTHQQLKDLVTKECEYLLPYLPSNGARKELDVTHVSVLVDIVGPPSAEVCRTAASFP